MTVKRSLRCAIERQLGREWVAYASPKKRPKLHTSMELTGCDTQLAMRVPSSLRQAFQAACYANDRPYTQVIREMMLEYVERHNRNTLDSQSV